MTTYNPPFKAGGALIELGGGANPRIRPNADIRPGSTVDVVWDFEQPSPLSSNQFDGVLCIYAIEHISWRKVQGFMQEVHRMLKPGGLAVFITADLYAQCKMALEAGPEAWNDSFPSQTIFGDLDYNENHHRVGWSRVSLRRAFLNAGFASVQVLDHPDCQTDCIVEARKSEAEIIRGYP